MRMTRWIQGWALGLVMVALRSTCRVKVHDDPREGLRLSKTPYVYSILHAHQIAAAINREKNTAAMVSRSGDGELLMAGFWLLGIKAVRGSSGSAQRSKGGLRALSELAAHVNVNAPAIIAVDGPRGPRNRARKGIALLSRDANACVLNVVLVPSRRWILGRTWDRLQIPQPFCKIDAYFGEPLSPDEGETVELYRQRIEESLNALEVRHDKEEVSKAKSS